MSSRSAIHQLRATRPKMASREGSSQAQNMLYGWSPEQREPDPFEGPPFSDFKRGLPKRNRVASGRRPSTSKSTGTIKENSHQRRPSLVDILRAATGRRPSSDLTSSNDHSYRKRGPSFEAAAAAARRRQRRLSNESFTAVEIIEPSRKRGPSLLVKRAKELVFQSRTHNTDTAEEFRCLPDHLSRLDKSASENEKIRLWIESKTRCFDLVQRWKDPEDWLKPSNFWKRMHPAMNFRLWRVIERNPNNSLELKASAVRNLEKATLLYERMGGDSRVWWPEDLEEQILDSWSLAYGGLDPPVRDWLLLE